MKLKGESSQLLRLILTYPDFIGRGDCGRCNRMRSRFASNMTVLSHGVNVQQNYTFPASFGSLHQAELVWL